jgi:hypothetical protein
MRIAIASDHAAFALKAEQADGRAERGVALRWRYLRGRNSSTTTSCTDAFGGHEKCRWQ